jgi:hypothetical protein
MKNPIYYLYLLHLIISVHFLILVKISFFIYLSNIIQSKKAILFLIKIGQINYIRF